MSNSILTNQDFVLSFYQYLIIMNFLIYYCFLMEKIYHFWNSGRKKPSFPLRWSNKVVGKVGAEICKHFSICRYKMHMPISLNNVTNSCDVFWSNQRKKPWSCHVSYLYYLCDESKRCTFVWLLHRNTMCKINLLLCLTYFIADNIFQNLSY